MNDGRARGGWRILEPRGVLLANGRAALCQGGAVVGEMEALRDSEKKQPRIPDSVRDKLRTILGISALLPPAPPARCSNLPILTFWYLSPPPNPNETSGDVWRGPADALRVEGQSFAGGADFGIGRSRAQKIALLSRRTKGGSSPEKSSAWPSEV